MEKFGLNTKTITSILNVFKKHNQINEVIIYGSRAKGTHRLGSDIDLTLVAPSMNVSDLLKVENQLEELMLPYKIDLSLMHKIENQNLIDHINRVGQKFNI